MNKSSLCSATVLMSGEINIEYRVKQFLYQAVNLDILTYGLVTELQFFVLLHWLHFQPRRLQFSFVF